MGHKESEMTEQLSMQLKKKEKKNTAFKEEQKVRCFEDTICDQVGKKH